MASPLPGPVVDVVPLALENQKVGRFWLTLFAVSWAVTFLDGFDPRIISFAGRYIQTRVRADQHRARHARRGGPLGRRGGGRLPLGDRVGRKPALIISAVGCGMFKVLFAFPGLPGTGRAALPHRRFLGDALPLIWALVPSSTRFGHHTTDLAVLRVSSAVVFCRAFAGPILNERVGFSVSAVATPGRRAAGAWQVHRGRGCPGRSR
jgi:MFS transporter, AAHS family, 4-hydroxybenzoate transporter